MGDMDNRGTENRVEGKAEELKGRTRAAAGDLTGDTSEQLKGKGEELKGNVKQSVGKAQQNLDDR